MIPYQHKGCSGLPDLLPDATQPTVAICRGCRQEWKIRVDYDRQGKAIHKWVPASDPGPGSQDPWSRGRDPW